MRKDRSVLVMERGYIGDRFSWYSLGWNGLNGNATFPDKDEPSRFREHFSMRPWKEGGDYVLLIGQVPGDMSIHAVAINHWYRRTAEEAKKALGLPVFFREHPVAVKRHLRVMVPKVEKIGGDLLGAFEGARCVVTYNSNTAVEAVLAGIPSVTADRGSMAWEVTSHDFNLVKPDREAWASRLAWCQWTLEEMANGTAWEHVAKCKPAA